MTAEKAFEKKGHNSTPKGRSNVGSGSDFVEKEDIMDWMET